MNDDTGTDRVELTDTELDELRDGAFDSFGFDKNALVRIVESIVAARVRDLTDSHELMATQFRTMQREKEHGWHEAEKWEAKAEGIAAELAAANTRCAELEAKYAAEVRRHEETDGEWSAEFSEVKKANAALQARVDDYENGISWGTSCISCAKTLDSSYAEYVRAETLQATLDRVTALADEWEESGRHWARETGDPQDGDDLIHCAESVRAALTPEGTE